MLSVPGFNRTIKTRMWRYFSAKGTYRWIDIVQDLVKGYNNSKHRSIGMTPNQVNLSNEAQVRDTLYPPLPQVQQKQRYKLNDSVRISRKKGPFEKGYQMTYGFEVFQISEVKDSYPITYGIKDYNQNIIKGSFYDSELQHVDKSDDIWTVEQIVRTRTRRKKKEYLVKWAGYPESANSWVPHHDLFKL